MTHPDCERWHALDRKFGTLPNSPLHHDNRCACRLSWPPVRREDLDARARRLIP